MKTFIIQYTVTERTREQIEIVAETAEEAIHLVEEYEFDNSGSNFLESLEWSVSDVELVG